MPRSATPATQNDMTASSDTSKKSRFCGFSHRHGNFEATTAADRRLRTCANRRKQLRRLRTAEACRVTRTRVNPQTPKCKTTTLRYAFGKKQYMQSLHKAHPSTTLYNKACTKYFPVVLRTTKLAQTTSRYYFVLQSLHKVLPSTTSYYQACTKYFPVLLRTTKLAQSTSQYDFVLQNLHKVRPSTTSYYKTCTKNVSVLLRTTKLEVLPSTTSYYKTCTKYVPV